MTSPFTWFGATPPQPTRPFFRLLVAGVVALNLVVAGIGWFSLKQSRAQRDQRAAVNAQNISKILDENLRGMVEKVDIALLAMADEAERQLGAGAIQAAALNRFIVREHARLGELAVLRATDASGEAIFGPEAKATVTASLAHREYFRQLKEDPGAGLVISEPLVGGISGKWMIVLARRFNRPDGTFAGLVYAGVALDSLTRQFSKIDIGLHGLITLIDSGQTLVARHPADPILGDVVGRRLVSQPLSDLIQGGRGDGVYIHTSSLDGWERTLSLRRLGLARPFYILVGLARSDYLAEWRTEAWKLGISMAFFLLLSNVSAALLHREWRRNERETAERKAAQALLLRQKEALEATLARTKRLEGILSICMHCKKIHNQQEAWEEMEKYISDNSDAHFSHGVCPGCLQKHYPEVGRG